MAERPIVRGSHIARLTVHRLRRTTGLDVIDVRHDDRLGWALVIEDGRVLCLGRSKRRLRDPNYLGVLLLDAGSMAKVTHRSAHRIVALLQVAEQFVDPRRARNHDAA